MAVCEKYETNLKTLYKLYPFSSLPSPLSSVVPFDSAFCFLNAGFFSGSGPSFLFAPDPGGRPRLGVWVGVEGETIGVG